MIAMSMKCTAGLYGAGYWVPGALSTFSNPELSQMMIEMPPPEGAPCLAGERAEDGMLGPLRIRCTYARHPPFGFTRRGGGGRCVLRRSGGGRNPPPADR